VNAVSQKSQAETNFGSIEGAAEYMGRLLEAVNEAHEDLKGEALLAASTGAERREQAIQLATYKLSQLKNHLTTSHRLLNDLRTIRRLLFAERQTEAPASGPEVTPGPFVTTATSPDPVGAAAKRVRRAPRATTS
jgi:hypothetical protein